jgi:hypothetical protein
MQFTFYVIRPILQRILLISSIKKSFVNIVSPRVSYQTEAVFSLVRTGPASATLCIRGGSLVLPTTYKQIVKRSVKTRCSNSTFATIIPRSKTSRQTYSIWRSLLVITPS